MGKEIKSAIGAINYVNSPDEEQMATTVFCKYRPATEEEIAGLMKTEKGIVLQLPEKKGSPYRFKKEVRKIDD